MSVRITDPVLANSQGIRDEFQQQGLQGLIRQIQANPLIERGAKLLTNGDSLVGYTFTPGQTQTISHTLGRTIQSWFPVFGTTTGAQPVFQQVANPTGVGSDVAFTITHVPRVASLQHFKVADALASTTYAQQPFGINPFGTATVNSVNVTCLAGLTADNTNYATLTLTHYLTSGVAGAYNIVSQTTQTTGSGGTGNWTTVVPVNLTLASSVLTSRGMLAFAIAKTGTGVLINQFVLEVFITENSNSNVFFLVF